ncbi:MAG: 30S ribosome-binding factor RbfA [Clostridia bacterium]|nr:30S ribosome-binding factor RbfA [Clostridia bacterium]
MNHRIERVNAELQRVVADIIRNRVKNPNLTGMVSVVGVDTAKDLKTAKVIVSIYGSAEAVEKSFEALKNSAGFIRHELSTDLKDFRVMPQLTFVLDKSMEYSEKINTILEDIKQHDDH